MPLTREEVLELGFKEIGHFTIMNSLEYNLGRDRRLSFGSIGTPNEMLFITEQDVTDPRETPSLICLHNYDYDGYMTLERLQLLLSFFNTKAKK